MTQANRGRWRTAWLLAACVATAAGCRDQGGSAGPSPAGDGAPAPLAGDGPAPAATQASPTAAPADVEDPVPRLAVTTLEGEAWDIADARGRWVVVNFWATWCAPCLAEMPELSALDAMRAHVDVIGLAYEDTTVDALRDFLRDRPVVYPVALVGMTPPPGFATPRGLPMTYLVGPDGATVRRFLGPVTAAEIETAIAAAGGRAPGA